MTPDQIVAPDPSAPSKPGAPADQVGGPEPVAPAGSVGDPGAQPGTALGEAVGGTTSGVPPGPSPGAVPGSRTFTVALDNFTGPFDLLLQLISRHKLDITEVALSKVTDEFVAHIKAMGDEWDLDQVSSFIVVAATLLDLKAARLLPSGEVDDPEDLALLEARDLLFARLLQYRAYQQVASWLCGVLDRQGRRHARPGGLEPQFVGLLPEAVIPLDAEGFAALAARALTPRAPEEVSLAHLHASQVSVREQALVVVDRLRHARALTFRALTGDSPDKVTTVCRFLALLELFREGAVAFEQLTPLGELTIRWTGSDDGELQISDEFDVARPRDDEVGDDETGGDEAGGDEAGDDRAAAAAAAAPASGQDGES